MILSVMFGSLTTVVYYYIICHIIYVHNISHIDRRSNQWISSKLFVHTHLQLPTVCGMPWPCLASLFGMFEWPVSSAAIRAAPQRLRASSHHEHRHFLAPTFRKTRTWNTKGSYDTSWCPQTTNMYLHIVLSFNVL